MTNSATYTGNDFIYPDDFKENLSTYLEYTGQVDAEGRKFSTNTDTEGRFHSNWLNMMYPRLFLAKNLLRDDGVIFISIDDNEVCNLRKICDEIFGEENFVANITWSRKRGKDNSAKYFSRNHEYLICYSKNILKLELYRLKMSNSTRKAYSNKDNDNRGDYRLQGLWSRGSQGGSKFSFISKNGKIFSERMWLVGKDTMEKLDKNDRLVFIGDKVYRKLFLSEYKGDIPETIWLDASNAANAADEIKSIFGFQVIETVKPIPYIIKMLRISASKDDIILDFFAGSGTTAHAVLDLNKEEGGNRKFIMVQLPEKCDEKSEAYKAGFKTIADIGKERIRRVIDKIKQENSQSLFNNQLDLGFKAFKLDSSNFKIWNTEGISLEQGALEKQLELHLTTLIRIPVRRISSLKFCLKPAISYPAR